MTLRTGRKWNYIPFWTFPTKPRKENGLILMKEAALGNVFKGRLQKQSLKEYRQSTIHHFFQESDYQEEGSFKASSALLHKRFHLYFKKGQETTSYNQAPLYKAFPASPDRA